MSNKQRTHHGKRDALSDYKFGWKPPTVKKGQYVSRHAGMGRASDLSAEVRREEIRRSIADQKKRRRAEEEDAYRRAVAAGSTFHLHPKNRPGAAETHALCMVPLRGEARTSERDKATCPACMVALDEGLETGLLVLTGGRVRWAADDEPEEE